MTLRHVAATAASVSLSALAVAGCATVDAPAYPVIVERELAGARLGASAAPASAVAAADGPVAVAARSVDAPPAVVDAIAVAGGSASGDLPGPVRPGAPASGGGAAVGILESGRTITVYASDDAFRAVYETDTERLNIDDARFAGGFLLSEERDNVFSATMLLDTFPDLVPDVRLSFGARAYVALLGVENRDVFGLGLGVQGAYELPVDFLPLQLGSEFFYTPDALAFGQSDRIVDWNIDVGLAVRENISAFVGFRFLQFDTRPGDRDVEDDIHVGVRWAFGNGDEEEVAAAAPAPAPPRFR